MKLSNTIQEFIKKYPEVWKSHEKTGELIHNAGPLDKKNSHLIQSGITASLKLYGAFCSHVSQAIDAGATPDEIYHAVLLLKNTAGFPTMMMAYSWTEEIIEKIQKES